MVATLESFLHDFFMICVFGLVYELGAYSINPEKSYKIKKAGWLHLGPIWVVYCYSSHYTIRCHVAFDRMMKSF